MGEGLHPTCTPPTVPLGQQVPEPDRWSTLESPPSERVSRFRCPAPRPPSPGRAPSSPGRRRGPRFPEPHARSPSPGRPRRPPTRSRDSEAGVPGQVSRAGEGSSRMTEMTKELTPRRPPGRRRSPHTPPRPRGRPRARARAGPAGRAPPPPAPPRPGFPRRPPAPGAVLPAAQAFGEHGACPLPGAAGGHPAVLLLYPVQLQGHRNALASDLRRELEIPDVH